MTVFEKLAQSPKELGAFLRALPVIEAPWDAEFQKQFCAGCAAENCDACPNEKYRNNPDWWLSCRVEMDTEALPPMEENEPKEERDDA